LKLTGIGEMRRIGLEDIDAIRRVYNTHPPPHSDYSIVTMLAWQHYMEYHFAPVGDHLLFMTVKDGKRHFRGPVGDYSDEDLQDLLSLAREHGDDPPIGVLDHEMAVRFGRVLPGASFVPHRDFFDYIYRADTLRDLPGKDFLKVRNQLNHFQKNRDYKVEPMDASNRLEAMDFFIRWCEDKGCSDDDLLRYESGAIRYCMENFDALGLEGLVIRMGGRIEAATIFEVPCDDTAIVHVEKADPAITGAYQAINNESARALSGRVEFINRESDMGLPGLRMVKERYRPDRMIEVFHLDRDQLRR